MGASRTGHTPPDTGPEPTQVGSYQASLTVKLDPALYALPTTSLHGLSGGFLFSHLDSYPQLLK
jgi:acyl-coenzyme A thioesterase PaaI-like protein